MWYTQSMASLQKHRVGGRTYWRIVESRRVNGKPRPVPVAYLGTADALLARLQDPGRAPGPIRLSSKQHGNVAALKAMADRLGVAEIIDRHVGPARRSPSVGTTLLLAALNRAVQPRSKRGWAEWAADTTISHLFGLTRPDRLNSQFFWDQMNRVSPEALEAIEGELVRTVVDEFHLKLETLLYDTTNFFTYIASTNTRPKLPQRGHSKQKRVDLRLISWSVLCARESQIPLCTHVYDGNVPDVVQFSEALGRIQTRLEALLGERVKETTIVYDMGNNSRSNQAQVDEAPFHYVGGLPPSRYRALREIPLEEYTALEGGPLAGLPVYRCKRVIWGAERTLVLYRSDLLREGQMRGLHQHLKKRIRALTAWQDQLANPRSRPRNAESLQKRIASLTSGQYVRDVLRVEFDPERSGRERLTWSIDQDAVERLDLDVFGKRILMTDQHDWTSEEIILAYRGQHELEAAFRQVKDPTHLAVRPQFHWTDQKLRVHIFICLISYILARLVHHEARTRCGWTGSLSGLLNHLGRTRLAMVMQAAAQRGKQKITCNWILEEGDGGPSVFEHLVPPAPPFVYTHTVS